MRNLTDPSLLKFRVPHPLGPEPDDIRAWVGAFMIPYPHRCGNGGLRDGATLKVIASRGGGPADLYGPGENWDHVSVSIAGSDRCPIWPQMCFVKDLFFERHEVAMQLHPVRDYINNHPGCLHLWRPIDREIPLPPSILVGLQELNVG